MCSVSELADMVALGLGLPAETFTKAGRYGFVLNLLQDARVVDDDM